MEDYTKTALPLYLRQDQFDALQALAGERHMMMDELIREGVDALLASAPEDVAELLRQRREELLVIAQLSVEVVREDGLGDVVDEAAAATWQKTTVSR